MGVKSIKELKGMTNERDEYRKIMKMDSGAAIRPDEFAKYKARKKKKNMGNPKNKGNDDPKKYSGSGGY